MLEILIFTLTILNSIFAVENPGFSAKSKDAIVSLHNDFRSKCARGVLLDKNGQKIGPAKNMRKLYWSNVLEKSAQNFAQLHPNGPNLEYFGNLTVNIDYFETTQRISNCQEIALKAGLNWRDRIGSATWKGPVITREYLEEMDESLRMLWAETTEIGCGLSSKIRPGKPSEIYVVCIYHPGGLDVGAEIFKSGKTCSGCPANTKCEENTGLCI
ncbi:unnamed protein product [Caenorhabditis angaria]|uniref:SCP domain-containing protein n=1 Tax=Caenorhabditis angaria TaxID=860376 RepID=A0A9P1INE7_9PELO|nr:unnamed protein product [Caenorhabditis angaria]